MKKTLIVVLALVAVVAQAAPKGKAKAAASDETKLEKVVIDQFPKVGRASTLVAPALEGASLIGRCYNKPRRWIVLEAKYSTYAKWMDQLTVTWHVLLETKSATEKDKEDRENLAPYSYFTTSVTYYNVPKGSHAASVCLPPSYLERFGEPKAIGLVIANKDGKTLEGNVESEIKGILHHPPTIEKAFWNDAKIINATDANGGPMIERRQGLLDRAKTIWSLVNPNDYETTLVQ